MANSSLDLKEELGAVQQWFRVLKESERTAALYGLLQQATQVQIRFLLTVLQQMASKAPVNQLLSPASLEHGTPHPLICHFYCMDTYLFVDAMQQRLDSAMAQLNVNKTPRRRNTDQSPSSPAQRDSRHLDFSTIQAMFPDAAAALVQQRSLLSSNRNSLHGMPNNSSLPTTTGPLTASTAPRSPGLHGTNDSWPIPSSNSMNSGANDTPLTHKLRPRSADLTPSTSTWGKSTINGLNLGTPTLSTTLPPANNSAAGQGMRSPRVPATHTPSIAEDLASPFGGPMGGSWASMVNTPVVPMFSRREASNGTSEDIGTAASIQLAAWNASNRSNSSGRVINLDNDVRRFARRGRTSSQQQENGASSGSHGHHIESDTLNTPTHNILRGGSPSNILMYDEHGHLLQFSATPTVPLQVRPLAGSPLTTTTLPSSRSPRATSPYPPGFTNQFGVASPIALAPSSSYLNPYDSPSPILSSSEFPLSSSDRRSPLGYHLHSSNRNRFPSSSNNPQRRSSSAPKPLEDPLDPALLNDIPAWLRSLRLHKYTDNLADVKGGVPGLAMLTESDLEARGVSAVGARRKLLKCFETVRAGINGGSPSSQGSPERSPQPI